MKKVTPLVIGLMSCLIFPAPALSAAAEQGTFEFGHYGHLLVPVSISDGPAQTFAFDTGASHVVLDSATYASQFPASANQPESSNAHGAHGAIAMKIVKLDSVRLWDIEQRNLEGVVLPVAALGHEGTPDFVGVLGIPYLSRFELDIDFARQTLAMRNHGEGAACEVCRRDDAIELGVLPGGLVSMNITVNGKPIVAVLDSGAAKSVLNAAAAGFLMGPDADAEDFLMANIGIGDEFVSQPTSVTLLELPVFTVLGLDRQPAMILGLDVLGSTHMLLDIEARKAWFQPSPSQADA